MLALQCSRQTAPGIVSATSAEAEPIVVKQVPKTVETPELKPSKRLVQSRKTYASQMSFTLDGSTNSGPGPGADDRLRLSLIGGNPPGPTEVVTAGAVRGVRSRMNSLGDVPTHSTPKLKMFEEGIKEHDGKPPTSLL